MAITPSRQWRKASGLCSYFTLLLPRLGSGMFTLLMMKKEMANTAIPMKSSGATLLMLVSLVTVPTSTPVSSGVSVPVREFSVPPI